MGHRCYKLRLPTHTTLEYQQSQPSQAADFYDSSTTFSVQPENEAEALFGNRSLISTQIENCDRIIDADESGEISMDEFVAGCMQLEGGV